MYEDVFQELGIAKNEGKIYETLLREGQSLVGKIAEKSGIHRRNVYDSLSRLIEKGLVFEILEGRENMYQAVSPGKLMDVVQEKEMRLAKVLPELEKLYMSFAPNESVSMYRGKEGWKNYLRDILRVGADTYIIGATGAVTDREIAPLFEQFQKESKRKGIKFHLLYRGEVGKAPEILGHLGVRSQYKILPEKYSGLGSVAIFGDHVVIISAVKGVGSLGDDTSMTIVVNQNIADTFRVWFQCMWDGISDVPKKKILRVK
ncbi:MAG: helix-turn-helix domain-containing protein [Candidatus Moraniibacteriota bacterium]